MVEFEVKKDGAFYILRVEKEESFTVLEDLDSAVVYIKNLIEDKEKNVSTNDIELMGMKLDKNKISAGQVSWATIAEKIIFLGKKGGKDTN